jgi:mannitol/fructose-specific phosphotransferase system IIA component (Ntr-type)
VVRFVSRLRPELIRIAPPWRTFGDTVGGLVDLFDAGALPSQARAAAVAAVTAREEESSTALLDIAAGVPHARLAGLARPAVALALSRAGLYEAVPTVAVQIVALVLSPLDSGSEHLDILAGIATLLRSPRLRTDLLSAGDPRVALLALRRHARSVPD